jgi:hypothetical protein
MGFRDEEATTHALGSELVKGLIDDGGPTFDRRMAAWMRSGLLSSKRSQS